ncbi:hypothetical protein B0A48_04375 [Cryoendolithus antarcticus]|uniref:Uncharacterized protein n=1 Tax=Cryoendolithus antarcticus TaxID=1507870 RepID=A0A1V8TF64_9PEZI|nr:hypothetical protein B0A48_04375 [Cryoendolithus antarcticus]
MNDDVGAPPFAVSVTTDAGNNAPHNPAPNLMSPSRSHAESSNAHTDVSFSQQSNPSFHATSSPLPDAVSPSGCMSGFSSHDENLSSSDVATTHSWTQGVMFEEPLSQAGSQFFSTNGTEMRRHEVRYTASMGIPSPTSSVEGIGATRHEAAIPAYGRRGIAARITRMIQRPARKRTSSPSSDASDDLDPGRANRRGMSWTEKFKRVSRASTQVFSSRKERQPTE